MSRWTDDELKELEDPDTWDQHTDVRPPVRNQRSVVSVAFAREDFEHVVQAARQQGMKTSEFIRNAALRQASGTVSVTGTTTISDGGGGFRRAVVTVASQVIEVTNPREVSYTR